MGRSNTKIDFGSSETRWFRFLSMGRRTLRLHPSRIEVLCANQHFRRPRKPSRNTALQENGLVSISWHVSSLGRGSL